MSTAQNMIAGAPISWGVCEVPGWGYQLPPDRVLTEMREIGLAATELGPEGFLPAEPEAMADVLSRHQLHAIGGFTPLLLHRPDHDPLRDVIEVLERYGATGARTLVLSAALTRQVPHRIAHTHMKDVDLGLARQVQSGRLTYTEAVRDGMYRPLGTGDVDVAAIVGHLRTQGYAGWYVLEQDTILTEEPPGEGPAADVNTSAAYLRRVISSSG
jgi:sugar phosphate isomerase/epimerase